MSAPPAQAPDPSPDTKAPCCGRRHLSRMRRQCGQAALSIWARVDPRACRMASHRPARQCEPQLVYRRPGSGSGQPRAQQIRRQATLAAVYARRSWTMGASRTKRHAQFPSLDKRTSPSSAKRWRQWLQSSRAVSRTLEPADLPRPAARDRVHAFESGVSVGGQPSAHKAAYKGLAASAILSRLASRSCFVSTVCVLSRPAQRSSAAQASGASNIPCR